MFHCDTVTYCSMSYFAEPDQNMRSRRVMFLYLLFIVTGNSLGEEKHCSKFHYEEKTLEKMIRMEIRMEEMQRKLDQLEMNVEDIKTPVTREPMTEPEKKTVAFFATLQARTDLGAGQKIVFENVVTNLGDAYYSTNGTFVAPASGTYVFFSTVLGSNDVELWNYIAVNDGIVANFNSHGTEGRHDSGTATIVVHLNKRDGVSVINSQANGVTYGESYTHFGGFRLDS